MNPVRRCPRSPGRVSSIRRHVPPDLRAKIDRAVIEHNPPSIKEVMHKFGIASYGVSKTAFYNYARRLRSRPSLADCGELVRAAGPDPLQTMTTLLDAEFLRVATSIPPCDNPADPDRPPTLTTDQTDRLFRLAASRNKLLKSQAIAARLRRHNAPPPGSRPAADPSPAQRPRMIRSMRRPDPTKSDSPRAVTLRQNPALADAAAIVHLHAELYACEYNFDATFADYVAGPLAEFMQRRAPRDRVWIAEQNHQLVGCIAIVAAAPTEAQLRWFLVHPAARGHGLGRTLLNTAVSFSRDNGYASIFLWTISALTAAAHLYRAAGFRLAEQRPAHLWGTDVIEERYDLVVRPR